VVAVSTIVSRESSLPRAGWIGALWGVGHTITILVVGAAIILFGFVIPPRLGLALEFSVALMLILLGVLNLTGAMKWISHRLSPAHPDLHSPQTSEHSHLHFHDGKIHAHPHWHEGGAQHHAKEVDPPLWLAEPFVKLGWFHSLRPLLVGIVHGLAGSAAVALLVLGTIREPRWAIFYLLLFRYWNDCRNDAVNAGVAVPVTLAGNRFAWISHTMVTGTGVVKPAVRPRRGIPDRHRGRTLLVASFVDAALTSPRFFAQTNETFQSGTGIQQVEASCGWA